MGVVVLLKALTKQIVIQWGRVLVPHQRSLVKFKVTSNRRVQCKMSASTQARVQLVAFLLLLIQIPVTIWAEAARAKTKLSAALLACAHTTQLWRQHKLLALSKEAAQKMPLRPASATLLVRARWQMWRIRPLQPKKVA
jgi:hypothetical protein